MPVGTVVINVATDEVIGDLTRHGDRLLVEAAAVAWATCTSRARPIARRARRCRASRVERTLKLG